MHHGHRQRVWNRVLNEGLAGFEPHQALELMLFQAQRRGDTNALAHLLLDRFGSFAAVLDADPKDLATVPGIGVNTARFIHLVPELTRYYLSDKARPGKAPLNDPARARRQVFPLFAGRRQEMFYLLCLDTRCRLVFPALIDEGTVDHVTIEPRRIVETALRHKATQVIFAHNHPSETYGPSQEDIRFTRQMSTILEAIGIRVVDHLIVAGNREDQVFSFAESGLLSSDGEETVG